MKTQLNAVLEKPMDRREFLGYIGATFLALIGVSGIVKALLNHAGQTGALGHQMQDQGYGSTAYGGLTVSSRL